MRKLLKATLTKDALFITISIVAAILLMKAEWFDAILATTKQFDIIGSFLAGIFFTSIFTTAPAIVALGEISQNEPIILTAILGGLGAVVGDLILFKFVKDRLSEHLVELYKQEKRRMRFMTIFRQKSFRWVTFIIGGIIIASPLPDELGISLLGFSRMKTSTFMLISFVFNFIGIVFIGIVANSI